ACQLRPTQPIAVNLLLRPEKAAVKKSEEAQGVERTLAVLFLDVRGFTSMSEDKLPYDVVYILNSLFAAIGAAIHEEGGWIDKYLGDGLMAVFGRDSDAEDGCRRAIRAAKRIDTALDRVNRELESELQAPLRLGIGLHVGSLVLGEIGHDRTAAMTVIGKTVNAASRLEAATKELKCQFAMSADAAIMAGLDLTEFETRPITVRGLKKPLQVITVGSARDLP
ncbi:MAG: adenylate/guanylate cyclase domain-containing protein, partial [Hyphomicrobiales bacterium]|nr:adenylate/guanylate cyclase domain-containing protein [Hyphomicrobiales bacterium]